MDTKFVNICGVPTKILTWGKRVGEKFDRKEIILFITGNPGLSGFYITFLATLFNCLQGNIPVWIIGWFKKLKFLFHKRLLFTFKFQKDTLDMMNLKLKQIKFPV